MRSVIPNHPLEDFWVQEGAVEERAVGHGGYGIRGGIAVSSVRAGGGGR